MFSFLVAWLSNAKCSFAIASGSSSRIVLVSLTSRSDNVYNCRMETPLGLRERAGLIRYYRAILLGLLLVPVNVYVLMYMEVATNKGTPGTGGGPYPSTISLFGNTILFLVALTVINRLLARGLPRIALERGELLVVYMMLVISTAIVSIDFLDVLVPMMTYPFRFATPENRWIETIHPHIPAWISVRDPAVVKGWYEGHSTMYDPAILRAWALPVAVWSGVIMTMLFVMFCINTIVRQQWMQHDKLQFPIVELPMQITEPGHRLLKSKLMWGGFAISGGICLLNGLSVLYPALPSIPVKMWDIAPLLVNKPFNSIGWTPISFYPYGIGLAFLLPLDMLFSCWFFFVMWRVIRIVGALYGAYDTTPNFPFMNQQALGAYYLVGMLAIWSGRKHLAMVWRAAFTGEKAPGEGEGPMSYRLAVLGMVAGIAAVAAFFQFIGLEPWMAVFTIGLYFFLALAISRMHAEFGPPAHDLHGIGPDAVLTSMFGTRMLTDANLVGLSWFWWFNRAYRSMPIAYQLDGLKIAQRANTSQRYMALAMGVASVAAVLSGFWLYLHFGYERGASAGMAGHVQYFGFEAFGRGLAVNMSNRTGPLLPETLAIGWGGAFAYLLYLMKLRLAWWPFHPLGFAVSTSYSIGTLWLPMAIAWAAKLITLRAGGLKAYKVVLDFFLGLVLGDFIVGCMWPVVGWAFGVSTYSFMQ